MKIRIGIYGGAFDPPHLTHVGLAKQMVKQLKLDRLHIIPTGEAAHRQNALTNALHRLEMAKLAFADVSHTLIDDCEIKRNGVSFTVETLQNLQAQNPDAQLFLLIGSDQLQVLHRWREFETILKIATISVAFRPDFMEELTLFDLKNMFVKQPFARFEILNWQPTQTNATEIRSLIQTHQAFRYLLNPLVADYIELHQLYQNTHSSK